ncbi:uncharacterized protein LOC132544885 [Ylistrum balloti]|uniref:uncharacterized protein LOC132544885 n=1 Tax=Ylistrum balloti TaxID=509963 RepID=UPI002905BCA7|nr:uncharacterized protein LOC132544885 [Ylistrum balloti]
MPRKRKKSNRDRRPPLIFTESPVANQRNVPSPVCCALHPRTAETIPVDQLDKSSWVSPQFSSTVQSRGQCNRRTLRRRKSPVDHQGYKTKCTCESASHNQVKGQGHTGNKYQSLEFVGNKKVRTSISVLEEVSIEENVSPNVSKHQRKFRKQSRTSWVDDECENSPGLKRKVRRKTSRLSTRSVERDDLNRGDNSLELTTADFSPLPGSVCAVGVCTPSFSKQNIVSLQTPVKQLFPGSGKGPGHVSEYGKPNELFGVTANLPTDDCMQSSVYDEVCESDVEDSASEDDHEDLKSNLKSRYFLRKYFEMTVCSTPKDGGARGARILVLDTPEAEYGLASRRRQQCVTSKATR